MRTGPASIGRARLGARRIALLVAFAALTLLPGRITLPPLDRDESRYMEASAQMLASGDLVDVRFQDQPRYLQPAGIYWLEAASVRVVEALTGSAAPAHEGWAYRIPSFIAAIANVVLTASTGALLFGADAGVLAGLLFAASVLFNVEGRMATIDTVLLTCVLAAERALLAAWLDRGAGRPTRRGAGLFYWAALGAGLMLKGPVVLIPGWGTLAALCLATRSLDMWRRMRPALGLPLMIAIVAPWCAAILVVSHGTFFTTAIGHNLLGKVAGGQQAHGLPPGTYLGMFLASFWPGSLFAALAIPFVWSQRRDRRVGFLLTWILPHWAIYEAIATKLPHYVLPAFPAIAILSAAALVWPAAAAARAARVLGWVYGALWLASGLAFAAAGPVLLARLQGVFDPFETGFAACGGACVIAAAALLVRGRRLLAARTAIAGAFVLYAGLFLFVVPELTTIWLSPRIARTVALVKPCPDSHLTATSFTEPSLIFLAGRDTRLGMPQDAARALAQDRCGIALVGRRDETAFRAALKVPVRKLAEIDGVNYSTGRHLALSLYTASPRQ